MRPYKPLLLCFLWSASLGAQRQFTVGGTLPDYPTLAQALASSLVSDGDVLLVRKGAYSLAAIRTAVSVLGETGVILQATGGTEIQIRDLGFGTRMVLKNAQLGHPLRIENCYGRVHVEDVQGLSCLSLHVRALSMSRVSMSEGLGMRYTEATRSKCSLTGPKNRPGYTAGLGF